MACGFFTCFAAFLSHRFGVFLGKSGRRYEKMPGLWPAAANCLYYKRPERFSGGQPEEGSIYCQYGCQ
jgi:hypothetical protein